MPYLSDRSKRRLETCDDRLQSICYAVIELTDFTVLCGHRGREAQTDAYDQGASKLQWPFSKHNGLPSLAVDLAPYPIDWQDEIAFGRLAGFMLAEAARQGVPLQWGYDLWGWDCPHFQVPSRN